MPPRRSILARRLTRRKLLIALAGCAAARTIHGAERLLGRAGPDQVPGAKRIYIAPDDHTDYMWSADEEAYRRAFVETLDYYLDLADATAGEPREHQSRWNCDGSFWLWTYERSKSQTDFERLIGRIRDGHISVPLNALCVCLGGAPAEAVIRGMHYPGSIERRYGVEFPLAVAMENQVLGYGLGALWSGAGAKYSWKGICGCASRVEDAWDREHEIYWWQGPDGSRILMKWNSMLGGNQGMGGYAEARDPAAIVEYVDDDEGFLERYAYRVVGAFGKGWDDLMTMVDEFVVVAKAKTSAERSVIVSSESDFFEDFERTYGPTLPTLACTFGNEWELYCASMAEVSARVKRAVERLRAAEAMSVVASLAGGGPEAQAAERDQAWMNLGLYWEHCWTGDGAVPQADRAAWSRRLADQIEGYADGRHDAGSEALAALIGRASGAEVRFVFNPLSWSRTAAADLGYDGPEAVHVVEAGTGRQVPSQVVESESGRVLRVLAADVPAIGYKTYEIREGPGQDLGPGPTADSVTGRLSGEHLEATVAARGALISLRDLGRSDAEMIRGIDGYFANDLGPGPGEIEVENVGAVSATLVCRGEQPVRHTSRLTLVRDQDCLYIHDAIEEGFSDIQAWRFGFEVDDADVWHEEVGAVIRARLQPDGHYSARNARYDWLTLNRFADVGGTGLGVTLSNWDCYFMRLGSSTAGQLDVETPQLSVLAGGQVDGPHLGIRNQGGDLRFVQRFALRPRARFDPAAAMRFAMEHQNPLVTGRVHGDGPLPGSAFSLLSIDSSQVLVSALKPADDGPRAGVIVRVWNMSHAATTFRMAPLGCVLRGARHASHIETPTEAAIIEGGRLVDSLAPQQLKTYLLDVVAADPSHGSHAYLPWAHG